MTTLPEPFLDNMKSVLGAGFPAFEKSMNEPAPISIRLNPAKPSPAFRQMETVAWHPHGRYLPERPIFTLDPIFHAGGYYVQEASSMFVFEALKQSVALQSNLRVLDLCAAPGGKSTLLASAVSPDSFLMSNEVIKSRVNPLRMNLTKWGCPNFGVSNHDPEDFEHLTGFFDVVLVDAPCSGEGLFRKDPAAADEWTLGNVDLCAARQQRILSSAKRLVKQGGTLIYSTCTFNSKEDEENVKWLVASGEFEHFPLRLDENWGIVEKEFGYQFYPHRLRGEGFFIAVLRRVADASLPKKSRLSAFQNQKRLSKKRVAEFAEWLSEPSEFEFFEKPKGEIFAIPKSVMEAVEVVGSHLPRRSFGVEIGQMKKRNFVPAHALALSQIVHPDLPSIELDRGDTLLFLKKENLKLETAARGWHLARFEGLNLGWMKLLEGRVNNYFPTDWRIRMALK